MNEIGPAPPAPNVSARISRPEGLQRGKRSLRPVLLVVVLSIVAGGVAVGLLQPRSHRAETVPPQSRDAAPLVTTARVEPQPTTLSLDVAGSLVARHEVPVDVAASGSRIDAVLAKVGDHVAKGQVLARLDTSVLQAELRHAQAAAEAAAAAATAAEAAFRRVDGIRGTGAVSAEQVGQRRADAASAEAQLAEARAATDEIAARLDELVVRAPVAGVVAARHAEPGAVAATGGTPLFELIEGGVVDFDAQVPQEQLARLAPGLPVEVNLGSPDDAAAATIAGHIRSIAPTLDPRTRLGVVHVALPDDPRLRSGAFVQGRIVLSHAAMLPVPLSAVQWQDGRGFVDVVADGHAQRRTVQTGAVQGGRVAIRSGLAAGDAVVLSAGAFLHNGEAVRQARVGLSRQ